MSSLRTRLKRLEEASGGGECPRCSGTVVVYLNGELGSVSRDGRRFAPEEAQAFVGEEHDGRCPVCGARRQKTKLGWPVGS